MIVIIIGILALLLAYVFFPIHSSEFTIGQTAISENLMENISNHGSVKLTINL